MNAVTSVSREVVGPLGVNAWFIDCGSGRAAVVDPGGDADSIISHLSALNAEPSVFFLTHGHFDHLSALPALKKRWPGVPVAIHPADSEWLGPGAHERHRAFFEALGCGWMVARYGGDLPAPDILLSDGEALPGNLIPGMSGWKVLHTPGHSPGSVCLYNEEFSILVSGDTLFRRGYGRTDGPGGSMDSLSRSLERLFSLPASTRVLPGHGEETLVRDEKM
ncbi:MAG: MBL fold metallo-hydrolase [Spirochaetales bacterium]|nr:MBL fold metallo-hydrolase [Spirochaetales bacterium]